jgi:hypothetical protein
MCDKNTVTLQFDLGDEIYIREILKPFKDFCPCPVCDPTQSRYDIFTKYVCTFIFAENCEMMYILSDTRLSDIMIKQNLDHIANHEYIQYYIKSLIIHGNFLMRQIKKLKTT